MTSWVTTCEVDHPLADGLGHVGAQDEGGDEVEEGRPEHRLLRREHAGGDDGGDGVRGVVEAVQEVEDEGDEDDEDENGGVGGHRRRGLRRS